MLRQGTGNKRGMDTRHTWGPWSISVHEDEEGNYQTLPPSLDVQTQEGRIIRNAQVT